MKAVAWIWDVAELKSGAGSRELRAAGHAEALRSGSPGRYIKTLRELLARFRSGKLSPGEQHTFLQVLTVFVDEMSAALDKPREEIRAGLRSSAGLRSLDGESPTYRRAVGAGG